MQAKVPTATSVVVDVPYKIFLDGGGGGGLKSSCCKLVKRSKFSWFMLLDLLTPHQATSVSTDDRRAKEWHSSLYICVG